MFSSQRNRCFYKRQHRISQIEGLEDRRFLRADFGVASFQARMTETISAKIAYSTSAVPQIVNVKAVGGPVAVDDGSGGNPIPILNTTTSLLDVLGNDSDPDGDDLTISAKTDGVHGTVAITSDAKFVTYTPNNPEYTGSDVFTYTISDGNGGSATVSVYVSLADPTYDLGSVLPLGDSITKSVNNFPGTQWYSYRYELWKDLIDSGVQMEFAGTLHDLASDLVDSEMNSYPLWPSYQNHVYYQSDTSTLDQASHEGHPGSRIDEIAGPLPTWLTSIDANNVLIHLGTNDAIDVARDVSGIPINVPQDSVDNLAGVIGALQTDNPNVSIYVAQIIPLATSTTWQADAAAYLDEFNSRLAVTAPSWSTANSSVYVVDHNTGFNASIRTGSNPNGLTYDGVHMNDAGDAEMASRWHDGLLGVQSGVVPNLADAVFALDENPIMGASVGSVTGAMLSSSPTFKLVQDDANHPGAFAVNSATGEVTVAAPNLIDHELADTLSIVVQVTADNYLVDTATVTVNVNDLQDASIADRRIFYNNSAFDGNNSTANVADDNAVAPNPTEATSPELGKTAYLPGTGQATFQNYTSYSRGINGIMVDIADLSVEATLATVDNFFNFQVGNSNNLATWTDAPNPIAVTTRFGEGTNGSDRITIIWADNAIQKQWLRIEVLANSSTGLATPDVHYWGNAIGETGTITGDTLVDGFDVIGARDNATFFVSATTLNRYDFNRDANVDAFDTIIARDNATFFTSLQILNNPN
ncbi:MAG: Ig-like domain-containing protein [Pirellulaceae bacterium]